MNESVLILQLFWNGVDVHQITSHVFDVCDMTFEIGLIEKGEEISSFK